MNKTDLVEQVAFRMGKTKKEAAAIVDTVLQLIVDALKSGDKVTLLGFGNFEVRQRAARMGRNPQTGENIQIEASRVPAFKPGKQLKQLVNQ